MVVPDGKKPVREKLFVDSPDKPAMLTVKATFAGVAAMLPQPEMTKLALDPSAMDVIVARIVAAVVIWDSVSVMEDA
jgi:hypothetical protein